MTSIQISAIFFAVGFVAVLPVLYYYYKRNPNPRFRPPIGEMAMISLFALMFVGGGSYFMGAVLSSNPNFDEDAGKNRGASRPAQQQQDQQQSGKSEKKSNGGGFNPFSK